MTRPAIQSTVRNYVPGELISTPGIYRNVPMHVYHAQCCIGPSVSSSNIRKAESRNMEHAFEEWSGNPDYVAPTDVAHFAEGRMIHDMAGEAHEFENRFRVRPEEFDNYLTKAAKAWKAQAILDGFTPLSPDQLEMGKAVIRKLQAHPTIQAGILHGLVEHSIFWIDEATGLWCKARPDVIPIDSGMVVDLKTTTDASLGKCIKAISEYQYHIQMALIKEGLAALGYPMSDFVLLFVEKSRPYSINHKPVATWAIEYGQMQIRRTLDRWAECLEAGEWTGYEDDEVEIGLADWQAKSLKKQLEEGRLPRLNAAHEEEAV